MRVNSALPKMYREHTTSGQHTQSWACALWDKDLCHRMKTGARSKSCPCWEIQDKHATGIWLLFSERCNSNRPLRKLKRTTVKRGICCKMEKNYMQSQLLPLINCVVSGKSKTNQYLPTMHQTLYYKMSKQWWTRQTQLQSSRSVYSRVHTA